MTNNFRTKLVERFDRLEDELTEMCKSLPIDEYPSSWTLPHDKYLLIENCIDAYDAGTPEPEIVLYLTRGYI